jgi:hypothetical protein
MTAIRERVRGNGVRTFHVHVHVQVRMRGFPACTATFPNRRQAERWAKTVEAEMIEGRHFRNVKARRRTLAEAIDRYVAEAVPKKRNGGMYAFTMPWWRKNLGHLRLSDVTPSVLVEQRGKLGRETYTRAKPESKRSAVRGRAARHFTRSAATVNRYLANLSHVFTVARKEWHWISHNPFDDVSLLDEGPGRVRFLSEDERARLLAETAKDRQLHTFTLQRISHAKERPNSNCARLAAW